MSSSQQNGIDTTADENKFRVLKKPFKTFSKVAGKIISSRGDKTLPVAIRQTTPQPPPKDNNNPHLPVAAEFTRPRGQPEFPPLQTPGTGGAAAGPLGTQPGQTPSSSPLTNGGHLAPGLPQDIYPAAQSLSLPPVTDEPFVCKYTDEGQGMRPETASDKDDTIDLIIQSHGETATPSEQTGPIHEVHGDSRTASPSELPLTTASREPAELDTTEAMPGQRRSGYAPTQPSNGDTQSFLNRTNRGQGPGRAANTAVIAATFAQAKAQAQGNTNPAQTQPQPVPPRKTVSSVGRATPASPPTSPPGSRPPRTTEPISMPSQAGRATSVNHTPLTAQPTSMSSQTPRETPAETPVSHTPPPTRLIAPSSRTSGETPQDSATPTIQAVNTPSQTEQLGDENQGREPAQQENADRTGTMSGESVTSEKTEGGTLPSGPGNDNEEDTASDDGKENDQASTVVDEQVTAEGQGPGLFNRLLHPNKNKPKTIAKPETTTKPKTNAKPQTIVKASTHPPGYEDWYKRLKKVQKQHKIQENPLHDLLSNVVQWFMDQIAARDKTIREKEQTIQARTNNIGLQEQEILRLRSNLRQQGEGMQKSWEKAEKEKKEAQSERQHAEAEKQTALNNLATAESQARNAQASADAAHEKLLEREQLIIRLRNERNAARQKNAQYIKDISARDEQQEATVEELRRTRADFDAAVRERDQLDRDFTEYWEKTQKTESELTATRGHLEQVQQTLQQTRQNLTNTIAERDGYKKTSAEAHGRYGKLQDWHEEEMRRVLADHDKTIKGHENEVHRINTEHAQETRRTQQDHQQELHRVKGDHAQQLKRVNAEHAQHIQRVNAEHEQAMRLTQEDHKEKFYEYEQEVKRTQENHNKKVQEQEQYIRRIKGEHAQQMYRANSDHALRIQHIQQEAAQDLQGAEDRAAQSLKAAEDKAAQDLQELQASLETLVQNYEDDKAKVEDAHKEETDRLGAELDGMKGKYKAKLKNETARLNVQVRNLQTRMASYSNRDAAGAIPDDEFRSSFLQLARRINNLISWVPRPSTYRSVPELDPDDFLTRTAQQGGRNWPKFVRSVCWRAIVKGFFSRQLGFGALGSQAGEGFNALDQLYQLFAVADPKNPRGPRVILPHTKDMNAWRAGFFTAVLRLVRQGSAPNNVYIRLYNANVQRVVDDLAASLERVTGSALGAEAKEEISGFVSGLGTLALEMASQRSHVLLETCERGRPVGADMFKSESEQGYGDTEVDIMTQPCIKRVGDGQDDLRAERIIAQGDFVPLRG
ncbi:hypothetical protein ACJZ2D_001244 [Fusarium nematophilum]